MKNSFYGILPSGKYFRAFAKIQFGALDSALGPSAFACVKIAEEKVIFKAYQSIKHICKTMNLNKSLTDLLLFLQVYTHKKKKSSYTINYLLNLL